MRDLRVTLGRAVKQKVSVWVSRESAEEAGMEVQRLLIAHLKGEALATVEPGRQYWNNHAGIGEYNEDDPPPLYMRDEDAYHSGPCGRVVVAWLDGFMPEEAKT